jgi:antitoxin component YwqK of YwqJK toxin-antitoxin module
MRAKQLLSLALVLWLPAAGDAEEAAAGVSAAEVEPDVFVVSRDAPLPADRHSGDHRRLDAMLQELPEGHSVKVRYFTFAPSGAPLRYIRCLTPLNTQGEANGMELHFPNWYQRHIREVPFRNGKPHGMERHFDVEGNVKTEIPWANGELHGSKRTYHPTGQLANETVYEHGDPAGESRTYTADGKLERVVHFARGERHGDMIDYWPETGQTKRVVPYAHGEVHGVSKAYYSDGALKWERSFKHNVLHGAEKQYAADGTLERTRSWKDGQPAGD